MRHFLIRMQDGRIMFNYKWRGKMYQFNIDLKNSKLEKVEPTLDQVLHPIDSI